MESTGFGILPEDLMTLIVFISDLKTASSILVSCKYWYNKYKHIINHDTITISDDSVGNVIRNFPKVITVKNGRVIRYGELNFRRNGINSTNRTKIEFFDNVGQLAQFLGKFNMLLMENINSIGNSLPKPNNQPNGFWMRIQNPSKTEYFNLNTDCVGVTYMHGHIASKIWHSLQNLSANREVQPSTVGIQIEMFERNPNCLRDMLYHHIIYVSEHGDVHIESYMGGSDIKHNLGKEMLYQQNSPDFYNKLKEWIVHDKGKINQEEIDKLKNEFSARRVFLATTSVNKQSYWFVEYDEAAAVKGSNMTKTIARKPDVIRKFVKLLEIGIYGTKNIQNPHFNHKEVRDLPPPQSVMYNMAKRFPYCIDLMGLPATSTIIATLKRNRVTETIIIACYNNGCAPIEEVLELLHFVETHLDPVINPKTKNPSYQVGSNPPGAKPLLLSLEIDSISIFKQIRSVKREVVQRIWSFIEKYHSHRIPP